MVDEARPEFPDIGFDLPDERVQFRQKNAVPIGAAILAPANYSPAHDNDQYSDGADCRKNLLCQCRVHLWTYAHFSGIIVDKYLTGSDSLY